MAIQFLNNVNADSGVLYVDAVNDRVGIGTAAPAYKLDVSGSARLKNSASELIIDNSTYSEMSYGPSNYFRANGSQAIINGPIINFSIGGNEKMRVASDGNVGIGTTSPNRKLQVIGTDGAAKFYYNSSFTNSQYSVVDIGMMTSGTAANGFGPKITFRMGGNGFDGFTAGAIGTVRNGADGTHNMTFATSTSNSLTTKMTITNTGNVGIGTTSPVELLHVEGNNATIQTVESGGATVKMRSGSSGRFGTYSNHNLAFVTNTNDRMTITSTGNVGIGTTSPSEKLDVNGTVNLTNLKIATAQGSDGQVLTSTGSGIAWEDVSVSGFLPTTGGTMTGDLRFNDNVYARFGSTGTGDLIIGHVDFGSPHSTILENGSGDLKIQATNLLLESANGETYVDCNFNGSVDLYYNNSKKFETTNAGVSTTGDSIITGDVGIGTTSPSAKLHVNGQNGLIVGDGNETGLSINNGTYTYKIGDIDGGENQSFIEIDSANQKTIFNNTNVGIGTTSPSSLIEMSATLDNTSSKLLRLTRSNQGSAPAKAVGFYSNSGERGSITVSNFATAYNTSSDYRLKENVIPIEDGINRLMSLKPCRFNFISEEQVVDGFIAHEAQDIVPEAISGEKDQIDEDGNEVYQGIDQAKLVPLLTAALQEAIKRIEILEQKNK